MPKVSVVIPTYNRVNFLGEAIRSVLDQTFSDFEIIVVDDGSTDNTREVVNSFKDPRLRYIYQENSGVSVARNNGIASSRAEYVAFLDSDDMYLEMMLEKSVRVLDANPEVGFSYGQIKIMREGFGIYRTRKSSSHADSTVVGSVEQVRELLFTCPITTSALTVRRDCFEKIGGFNEDLWYAEDYHLFVRLAKKYTAFYIAEPLIIFRFHDDHTIHKKLKPGKEKVFPMVLQEVFEDPEIAPQCEDLKKKAYSHSYRTWMFPAAYDVDMKLARQYLRQGIKFYPRVIFTPRMLIILYKYLVSFLPTTLRIGLRDFRRRIWYTKIQQE